jgi:D-ribose pyranose/furanose isomerase RbsD
MREEEIVNKVTAELFVQGIVAKEELEQVHSIVSTALTTYRAQVLEEFMLEHHIEWLKEDIKEMSEHRAKMKAKYPELFPTN